jgi:hypothetical protein
MTVSDIASIAAAGAATIAAFQIFVLRTQLRSDHERSRREKAVELMQFFVTTAEVQNVATLDIRRFAESLNKAQSQLLCEGKTFEVDVASKSLLPHDLIQQQDNNGRVQVDESACRAIKIQLMKYLNILETVATAWRHNIADREIIEEEFKSIVSVKTNAFVLEEFRLATGIYPSIAEFTEAIKKNQNQRMSKSPTA